MWRSFFARRDKTPAPALERTVAEFPACVPEAAGAVSPCSGNGGKSVLLLSYDFRLFRSKAEDAPPIAAAQDFPGFPTTPPDPQKETLKRRAADALIARHPELRICQFPYDRIAQFEHISIEEARRRHRHLEINSPEGGNGIQIILRDDEASVTVPFWHAGRKAADTFGELWDYLEIIRRETGYAIFDPQIGRIFDPAAGCGEALAHYNGIVRQVRATQPVNGEERHFPEIRELAAPEYGGVVLVAVGEDGAPFGFADVSIRRDYADAASPVPVAYLKGWYVEPGFRGRGIGRRLLEGAERWAAAHGLRALASDVKLENARRIRRGLSCWFTEARRAGHFIKPILVPAANSEAA